MKNIFNLLLRTQLLLNFQSLTFKNPFVERFSIKQEMQKRSVFFTNSIILVVTMILKQAQSENYKLVFKSLPTMTKRIKNETNMMKFSIHGEKIRFHISQREFLNYYDSQFFHFLQKTQYRLSIPIYRVAQTIERKFVFIPAFDKNSRKFS